LKRRRGVGRLLDPVFLSTLSENEKPPVSAGFCSVKLFFYRLAQQAAQVDALPCRSISRPEVG
jgi:hypothetical protein